MATTIRGSGHASGQPIQVPTTRLQRLQPAGQIFANNAATTSTTTTTTTTTATTITTITTTITTTTTTITTSTSQ